MPGLCNANTLIFKDECHEEGTEILTKNGFVDFRNITENTLVAQYNEGIIEWVKPTRIINQQYNGKLYDIGNERIHASITPNHDFLFYKPGTGFIKEKAKDAKFNHGKLLPVTAKVVNENGTLNMFERFCIAAQADANILTTKESDGYAFTTNDSNTIVQELRNYIEYFRKNSTSWDRLNTEYVTVLFDIDENL